MAIELLDLKTGRVTELPGSQELHEPAWSPDGRYVAAVTRDMRSRMMYDFKTGKWTRLPQGQVEVLGSPFFSHDGKYVYYENAKDETVYRVGVSDSKIEQVASFKDLRPPAMRHWARWWGLAPDDSVLAMRDLGTWEIYAFDVQP